MSDIIQVLPKPDILKTYEEAVLAGDVHQWVTGQIGTEERLNKNVVIVYSLANALYDYVYNSIENNKAQLDTSLTAVNDILANADSALDSFKEVKDQLDLIETTFSTGGSIATSISDASDYVTSQLG